MKAEAENRKGKEKKIKSDAISKLTAKVLK